MHFDDSFNLVFGIADKSLNWFDNPYVEVNVYNLDSNWTPTLSKDIKMKQCSKEDLLKFIDEYSTRYYVNSLCFDSKKHV